MRCPVHHQIHCNAIRTSHPILPSNPYRVVPLQVLDELLVAGKQPRGHFAPVLHVPEPHGVVGRGGGEEVHGGGVEAEEGHLAVGSG